MQTIFYQHDCHLLTYDWVSSDWEYPKTPEQYPYSFDSYYVWRDFDKTELSDEIETVYSDRMYQWNYEKAKTVFKGKQILNNLNKKECKKIVKEYFGSDTKCIGYALSCNISNGYPIGVFFIQKK